MLPRLTLVGHQDGRSIFQLGADLLDLTYEQASLFSHWENSLDDLFIVAAEILEEDEDDLRNEVEAAAEELKRRPVQVVGHCDEPQVAVTGS